MNPTEFEKFAYQCRLVGLTFVEFCEESHISESAARDLLTSKGGINYLVRELGVIRERTITVGDVVDVLRAKDAIDVDNLELLLNVNESYKRTQELLGDFLVEIDQ